MFLSLMLGYSAMGSQALYEDIATILSLTYQRDRFVAFQYFTAPPPYSRIIDTHNKSGNIEKKVRFNNRGYRPRSHRMQ